MNVKHDMNASDWRGMLLIFHRYAHCDGGRGQGFARSECVHVQRDIPGEHGTWLGVDGNLNAEPERVDVASADRHGLCEGHPRLVDAAEVNASPRFWRECVGVPARGRPSDRPCFSDSSKWDA